MKPILIILLSIFLQSTMTNAQCVTDKGAYQDGAGVTMFPFYNSCSQSVTVSVCVKSSGGGESVFNVYSGNIAPLNILTIAGGRWSTFSAYRWSENTRVVCPFF